MGDVGWTYQPPSNGDNQAKQKKKRKISGIQGQGETVLGVMDLRGAIAKLALREDR